MLVITSAFCMKVCYGKDLVTQLNTANTAKFQCDADI